MQEKVKSDEELDSYFELAKKETPIISVEEIGHVIANVPISQGSGSSWKSKKFWYIMVAISISTLTIYLMDQNNPQSVPTNAKRTERALPTTNEKPLISPVEIQEDSNSYNINADEGPNREKDNGSEINTKVSSREEIVKNESFYFQGDAAVHFEEEGKYVEMIVKEEVVQLKIDGKVIDPPNYDQYSSIIEKGKMMKIESDKLSDKKSNRNEIDKIKNKETMNAIISQLVADGILEADSRFEFRLTGTKMYLDEIEQSDSLYTKYRLLYENVSGNKLNAKSNIKIKH